MGNSFRLVSTALVITLFSIGARAQVVQDLLTRDLVMEQPGKEVRMLTVEYPPGGSSPSHRHNAQVFVYVLSGSLRMQVQGSPEVTLGPGQTFYESRSDVHTISANASKTEPAKFLVVMIQDKAPATSATPATSSTPASATSAGSSTPASPDTGAAANGPNRKIVLQKSTSGYAWHITHAPIPKAGPHQVLVHVRAVALNHPDLDMLQQGYTDHDVSGLVAGSDAAGDVVEVGAQVHGIHRGDRVTNTYFADWSDGPFSQTHLAHVFGWSIDGVFADYVVLPDTAVAPIPDGLSYEQAATLPTSAVTAWNAVTKSRTLHRDDVVLIQGTGGVSLFGLQFAHAMGAKVFVTSSSDDKLQRVKTLGASAGINYRTTPQWSDQLHELSSAHGADLVVDIGGKSTLEQSVRSLADGGAVSIVGGLTGYNGMLAAETLLDKSARAQGIFVGSRSDALQMNAFIHAHHIQPIVDRVFGFDQYQEALAYLRSGEFMGKIVLRL